MENFWKVALLQALDARGIDRDNWNRPSSFISAIQQSGDFAAHPIIRAVYAARPATLNPGPRWADYHDSYSGLFQRPLDLFRKLTTDWKRAAIAEHRRDSERPFKRVIQTIDRMYGIDPAVADKHSIFRREFDAGGGTNTRVGLHDEIGPPQSLMKSSPIGERYSCMRIGSASRGPSALSLNRRTLPVMLASAAFFVANVMLVAAVTALARLALITNVISTTASPGVYDLLAVVAALFAACGRHHRPIARQRAHLHHLRHAVRLRIADVRRAGIRHVWTDFRRHCARADLSVARAR